MIFDLAWHNLWYNKKRTILQLILIAITLSALVLFRGYVDYSREGMALGFIEKNGNIQISHNDGTSILDCDDLSLINSVLSGYEGIKKIDKVLEFSGIIGTEKVSTIFWGLAFDNPNERYGVIEGTPLFSDSQDIMLGKELCRDLNLNPTEKPSVNILTNTNSSGIALSSFAVSGTTSTNIPQNDKGLVIAPRTAILDFIGEEDIASCIQIFLKNTSDTDSMIETLNNTFNGAYQVQSWIELNPSYNQVNAMNEMQYSIISIIMCVLVFVSLAQSLSTAFNERLYEFGTLEAIGLKKLGVLFLLMAEVILLSALGLVLGMSLSWVLDFVVSKSRIVFIPPGYSEGFLLQFYITIRNIISSCLFIFSTCLLAMIIPIVNVLKNTVVRLMNHVE